MTTKPFKGIRPDKIFASIVNVPPYDVVELEEVKKAVKNNPYSFFHITRSEADLPGNNDNNSPFIYQKAKENFNRFMDDRILIRDEKPCYYLFSQIRNGRVQTGIYAAVSCEEYEKNLIKKHELTRKNKELDRTNHIMTVKADTGPVFLAFEMPQESESIFYDAIEKFKTTEPLYDFTDENNVENKLWIISEEIEIAGVEDFLKKIPCFYIADGHHRAASAVNVWKSLKGSIPGHNGNENYNYFMAVIFPSNELEIMPYNRIVMDLNGLSEKEFIEKIKFNFVIKNTNRIYPEKKGEIVMYINKSLYLIKTKDDTFDNESPLESLDVSILQNNLLLPVLGIDDPRSSERLRFIGGNRNPDELIRIVDVTPGSVSFSLYPVSMKELIAVTNSGQLMPPKSTWFEPKLRDGLVSYPID